MDKNEECTMEKMLIRVSEIIKKHDELAERNGEKFNIFSILDREKKEVSTHSRFIAELLSPKGTHGQKDKFLKYFIEELKNENDGIKEKLDTFDSSSAIIEVEKSIGNKRFDNDKPLGGQIDILIHDSSNNYIVIENKIDADDQDYQLLRYYNYINYENKYNGLILYLTPDKRHAKPASTTYKTSELRCNEHYYCISYRDFILDWLEKCIKKIETIPIINESFKQYIILIQKITNQLNTTEMAEINKIIQENLLASSKINIEYDKALEKVAKSLRNAIINKLESSYPQFKIEKNDTKTNNYKNETERFVGIFISIDGMMIGIESFNTKGTFNKGNLFIGIFNNELNKNNPWNNIHTIIFNDDLLKNLDKYGKGEEKEEIENEIVEKVKAYINERIIK